jgi:hypothetical protein
LAKRAPEECAMFKIITLFTLIFGPSTLCHAFSFKSGDLILLPLNCYSCEIIEQETQSSYSHSGVLIQEEGQWFVAEALLKVELTPLKIFLQRVRPGFKAGVFRPKKWINKRPKKLNQRLLKSFKQDFEGLPFDPLYLWDNFDTNGNEMLYCSEFLSKFLTPFLPLHFIPGPMDYRDRWEYWSRVYEGNVPQGRPGTNPGDIEHSVLFKFLGEI